MFPPTPPLHLLHPLYFQAPEPLPEGAVSSSETDQLLLDIWNRQLCKVAVQEPSKEGNSLGKGLLYAEVSLYYLDFQAFVV